MTAIASSGKQVVRQARRLAVGIDLGTTNSLVASIVDGETVVLRDGDARALLPSAVRYQAPAREAQPVVGYEAKACQNADPCNTLVSIKRLMGRDLSDIDFASSLPYDFEQSEGMVSIKTAAGTKNPVEVSADILRVLCQRAEAALGDDLEGVVITVPAHFDDAQRQATRDAAQLVGMKVLRLLNEPTAAAIAYGLDKGAEGIYAVYDLGGGTFDISILKLTRGVFEVLSTNGDTFLGGDDFDRRVRDWMVEQVGGEDIALTTEDGCYLLDQARRAKEALSDDETATLDLTLSDNRHFTLTLTQDVFRALVDDLIEKTMRTVRRAVRDAGLPQEEIDGVVMVGGATRMPLVQEAVAGFFGKPLLMDVNPDQVVAIGAAMQADSLVGNHREDDWLLLDVCSLSLGVETMGGLTEKIIMRNTTIPAASSREYTTFKDNQTAMRIHVVQGERDLVDHCRSLARFDLRGIPPMAAGSARVRVSFQIDADGLLNVYALEVNSGVEASVSVKPAYGLDEQTVARMLQELDSAAEEDRAARVLREAQVSARRMIDVTEAALQENGTALLSPSEHKRIVRQIQRLGDILASGDEYEDGNVDALLAMTTKLDLITREFASRRMDAGFQRVLGGRTVDQVDKRISTLP